MTRESYQVNDVDDVIGGESQDQDGSGIVEVGGVKVDLDAFVAPEGRATSRVTEEDDQSLSRERDEDNEGESSQENQGEDDEEGSENPEEIERSKVKGNDQRSSSDRGKAGGGNHLGVLLQGAIQEVFGSQVKIPFGKTNREIVETLQEVFSPRLHPEVMRVQQYVDQGGKVEDYFSARNQVNSMLGIKDDLEFMTAIYRQRYGKSVERPEVFWDDDKIASVLKKKEASGALDIEALEERDRLAKAEAQRVAENESFTGGNGGGVDPKDPQQIARLHADIDKATDAVVQKGKLFGLDLRKAGTSDDLKKLMRHYFTPLDKRGNTAFSTRMRANNAFIEAALLLHMADNGLIDAALLDKANGAKESFLKRLSTQPRSTSGGKSGPKRVDMDAMARPEGYR